MSDFDPIEFGRLQAKVEQLLASDKEKTALLSQLASDMTAVRLQLAEAKGGWKILVMLGGASASLGGFITWAANHYLRGAP
jgi:hypothetical protein